MATPVPQGTHGSDKNFQGKNRNIIKMHTFNHTWIYPYREAWKEEKNDKKGTLSTPAGGGGAVNSSTFIKPKFTRSSKKRGPFLILIDNDRI